MSFLLIKLLIALNNFFQSFILNTLIILNILKFFLNSVKEKKLLIKYNTLKIYRNKENCNVTRQLSQFAVNYKRLVNYR